MALDKTKLKLYLNDLPILTDEKRMWFRLGYYVQAPTIMPSKVKLIDGAMNETEVGSTVAINLRKAALEWWEIEKDKPRHTESGVALRTDAYDQLETARQE